MGKDLHFKQSFKRRISNKLMFKIYGITISWLLTTPYKHVHAFHQLKGGKVMLQVSQQTCLAREYNFF